MVYCPLFMTIIYQLLRNYRKRTTKHSVDLHAKLVKNDHDDKKDGRHDKSDEAALVDTARTFNSLVLSVVGWMQTFSPQPQPHAFHPV